MQDSYKRQYIRKNAGSLKKSLDQKDITISFAFDIVVLIGILKCTTKSISQL